MSVAPLWTLAAMAAAMRAQGQGALPQAVSGLSIDSRTIAPGEAYFAIKGDVHDGHDFVAAALEAGAALAVVEAAQREKFSSDAPLLVVDDVLAALVDLALAALSLSQLDPAAGRGVRRQLEIGSGEATLIDESYNANPASMAAALGVLGQADAGPHGRRIAVLGDMLELGPTGPELHRGLVEAVKSHHIDLVYCCGPLMRNLWEALSAGKRGGYADSAADLEAQVAAVIRAGDAIMIKGSLGSKMKTIVNALEKRFPGTTARDPAAV